MKQNYMIIITGMSATGKTTYAKIISEKLKIPLFCKDSIKEILFNNFGSEVSSYEEKRQIGIASYDIFYYQIEQLMKSENPIILESNFSEESSIILKKLIKKYNYDSITLRFEADLEILHKRFLAREQLSERHPALISNGTFDDFEEFKKIYQKIKKFKINDNELLINTTDFSNVDIDKVINTINHML